jgi:hypothetical protein
LHDIILNADVNVHEYEVATIRWPPTYQSRLL